VVTPPSSRSRVLTILRLVDRREEPEAEQQQRPHELVQDRRCAICLELTMVFWTATRATKSPPQRVDLNSLSKDRGSLAEVLSGEGITVKPDGTYDLSGMHNRALKAALSIKLMEMSTDEKLVHLPGAARPALHLTQRTTMQLSLKRLKNRHAAVKAQVSFLLCCQKMGYEGNPLGPLVVYPVFRRYNFSPLQWPAWKFAYFEQEIEQGLVDVLHEQGQSQVDIKELRKVIERAESRIDQMILLGRLHVDGCSATHSAADTPLAGLTGLADLTKQSVNLVKSGAFDWIDNGPPPLLRIDDGPPGHE